MAPNYAEESATRSASRSSRPTRRSSGSASFYIFCSYMFISRLGPAGAAQRRQRQFSGDIASAWYPLTDSFVGTGLTTIFEALAITSSFACAMALLQHQRALPLRARARERAALGLARKHPTHQSPYIAALVVAGFVFLYCLGFVIDDSSTEAALLKLGTYSPLLGVLGILFVQARLLASPSSSTSSRRRATASTGSRRSSPLRSARCSWSAPATCSSPTGPRSPAPATRPSSSTCPTSRS